MDPKRLVASVRNGLADGERRRLGELAVERGLITPRQLDNALDDLGKSETDTLLGEILVDRGFVQPRDVDELLMEQRRREFLDFLRERTETLPEEVEDAELDSNRVIGRYVLVEKIGEGAMAEVWKTWDRQMSRWVALKLLKSELVGPAHVKRFHREAVLAGQIRHPNIVAVHDWGAWNDQLYLVMDLVEHGDLGRWMKETDPDPRRIADVVLKICEAIQIAHERQVIHRDLKPSNVLIDRHGQPLLTDFGLARSTEDRERVTMTGQVLGTPLYMAPEQVSGDPEELDARCDIYSLGVMLYEMLSGRVPFEGKSLGDIFQQITSTSTPRNPSAYNSRVPRDLETICMRAISKARKDRYLSARDMAEDLKNFLEDKPIQAQRISRAGHVLRWARRNPLSASLGSGLLVVIIVGVALLLSMTVSGQRRIQALRQAGKAGDAYRVGALKKAYTLATAAVESDPGVAEGHFWAGRVLLHKYMRLRPLPTAWKIVGGIDFVPAPPDTPEEKKLHEQARAAFLGIRREALSNSEGWEWPCAQGLLALTQEEFEKAERLLGEARSGTDDLEIDYFYALSLYYGMKFHKALEVLDAIPTPRGARVELARAQATAAIAAFEVGRGRPGLSLYIRAGRICSEIPDGGGLEDVVTAHSFIRTFGALQRLRYNQRIEAVRELDDAIATLEKLPPRRVETWLTLGRACITRAEIAQDSGDRKLGVEMARRAGEALDQAEAIHPDFPILHLTRAHLLVSRAELARINGRKSEARDLAGKAVEVMEMLVRTPNTAVLQVRADDLLHDKPESYREAIRTMDEAIRMKPDLAHLYYLRGMNYRAYGAWQIDHGESYAETAKLAKADILKAEELAPEDVDVLEALALTFLGDAHTELMNGGDPEIYFQQIEEIIDRIRALADGATVIHNLRAHIQMSRATAPGINPAEAEKLIRESIKHQMEFRKLRPKSVERSISLASSYSRLFFTIQMLGRDARPALEQCMTYAQEALDMAPDRLDAKLAVVTARMNMMSMDVAPLQEQIEKMEEMLLWLGEVLKDEPNHASALSYRAITCTNFITYLIAAGRDFTEIQNMAINDSTRVLEWNPKHEAALFARAGARAQSILYNIQRGVLDNTLMAATLQDYTALLNANREHLSGRIGRAQLYWIIATQGRTFGLDMKEHYEGAYTDLNYVIKRAPKNMRALGMRADVRFLELSDAHNAGEKPERILSLTNLCIKDASSGILDPNGAPRAYAVRGQARIIRAFHDPDALKKDVDDAVDDLNKAIELLPQFRTELKWALDAAPNIRRSKKD